MKYNDLWKFSINGIFEIKQIQNVPVERSGHGLACKIGTIN